MKSLSPLAIASKANAPPPSVYFVPRFFPIFQYVLFIPFQPLYSASTAIQSGINDFSANRFLSLSLSLSSYLILSTFYPFVYFARKNRQVGGRGKRHFAGRKPRYIENSSRTKRIPRPWRRMSERSFRNRFVRGYREGDATENKEEDGKVIRWPFVVPSVK